MTRTYKVTYRSATSTLQGDVTAQSKAEAIYAAFQAWNVTSKDGFWSAELPADQVKAEQEARHHDMDETGAIA